MIEIRWLVCVLLLLPLMRSEAASDLSLEHYLPEDTWFVTSVDDLSGLSEKFESGDAAKYFSDDGFGQLLKPLKESTYWKHLSSLTVGGEPLTWEQFVEHFPGRVLVSFTGDEASLKDDGELDLVILADYEGEMDFLIDISTPDDEDDSGFKINLVEEEYLGLTLYIEEMSNGEETNVVSAWTMIDGVYVEGFPLEVVKETVERILDQKAEDSLAANAAYLDATAQLKEKEVFCFLNLDALMPHLLKEAEQEDAKLPPNFLGVTTPKLLEALRLETLDSVYFGAHTVEDGLRMRAGLMYEERDGILKLLAYVPEGDSTLEFIPDDALSASVSHFSLTGFWTALEEMLSKMSPNFDSFYSLQIDNLKNELGIDVRESLIENFGDRFIACTLPIETRAEGEEKADGSIQVNEVFLAEIKDPQSFEIALEALKDMASQGNRIFESREFLGTTIYTPIVPAGLGGRLPVYSYAIRGNYILLGTGEANALEDVLTQMEKDGTNFWEKGEIQDALARLPENPSEITYSDVSRLWKNLLLTLKQVSAGLRETSGIPLDLGKLSGEMELPYYSVTVVHFDDIHFGFETLILEKNEDE